MNDKRIIGKIFRNPGGKQWKAVQDQIAASQNNPEVPDLKPEIMKRINREKYVRQTGGSEVRNVRNFWQQPAYRFAFTFAAGIFVGVFLFSLVKSDFKDGDNGSDKMKGTFSDAGSPSAWTNCEILSFQAWQVKTSCRTRYSSTLVEAYLDLSSDDMIETTIEFNNDDFELMAVVPQETDTNTTFSTAVDHVRVVSSGDNKIGIKLINRNDLQHDITLTINQRGNQLCQNKITINTK